MFQVTNNIVISASSQTFHLKAGNDVDRQKWLSALEYARHKAIKQAESGMHTHRFGYLEWREDSWLTSLLTLLVDVTPVDVLCV